MATKTTMKKTPKTAVEPALGGVFRFIDIHLIKPSPTNPRTKFDQNYLDELADSIRRVGVLQPVSVRLLAEVPEALAKRLYDLTAKKQEARRALDEAKALTESAPGDKATKDYARALEKYSAIEGDLGRFVENELAEVGYQLIVGECRWRASFRADRHLIPAMIVDVPENEIIERQIIENLQRKNIEPLDEAQGFRVLMEQSKFSIGEIAHRVGKTEEFVHLRLRLNDLIPEGKKLLEKRELPVGHALEIVRFDPELQKKILDECAYKWGGDLRTLAEMKGEIERRIFMLLKHAPFSLKATNLRDDNLACVDCPKRTGAAPTLFDKPKPEQDACLDKECFARKSARFVELQRSIVTDKARREKADEKYVAPVVIEQYGKSEKFPEALNLDQYRKIENKKEKCPSAEEAIVVDPSRLAQKQLICRDPDCPIHNAGKRLKTPEKETEERRLRKEELFDYRVAKRVQVRVLREGMVKFDAVEFKDVSLRIGWFLRLLARLWYLQSMHSSDVMGIVKSIMKDMTDEKIPSYFPDDIEDRAEFLGKFSTAQQIQILFLFLNAYKGAMFYETYISQKEVMDLAGQYGIDYRLIDAEERHAICLEPDSQYKKHAPVFKEYADAVREGKTVKVPRIFTAKYKGEIN